LADAFLGEARFDGHCARSPERDQPLRHAFHFSFCTLACDSAWRQRSIESTDTHATASAATENVSEGTGNDWWDDWYFHDLSTAHHLAHGLLDKLQLTQHISGSPWVMDMSMEELVPSYGNFFGGHGWQSTPLLNSDQFPF
jgi:hypothetical protein